MLEGRSAWTFGRKLRYAIDSVFSFIVKSTWEYGETAAREYAARRS